MDCARTIQGTRDYAMNHDKNVQYDNNLREALRKRAEEENNNYDNNYNDKDNNPNGNTLSGKSLFLLMLAMLVLFRILVEISG